MPEQAESPAAQPAQIVWVKAGRRDGRSAFWERDRRHPQPGGEVNMDAPHPQDTAEPKAVQVAETEMVLAALQEGRLVRVDGPRGAPAEAKPAEPKASDKER